MQVPKISTKELIRYIEENGWELTRSNGHKTFKKEGVAQVIAIPHDKHVSVGVIRKILATVNGTYYGANHRR